MKSSHWKVERTFALTFALALGAGGCGRSSTTNARAVAVDSLGLHVPGWLEFANGSYGAGCLDRTGAWSVAIDGYSGSMDNAPLSVVLNNSACVLTLTALVADTNYVAAPALALSDSYQSMASAFAAASAPTAFYANAKLSALGFGSDFTITIPFSDDPGSGSGDSTGSYTTVSASATSAAVPAPSYTIDLSGFALQTDANDIVQSVSGSATLDDGSQPGEAYVVLTSDPGSSFAELDSAYSGATATAISGADPTLPAAAFDLVGVNLSSNADLGTTPVARYIIVMHAESGVRSYQLITVTFHPPV